MKKNSFFTKFFACMISLVLLVGMLSGTALAESYTASTMRLLHYEGTVDIQDASGSARAVMADARFDSGETMKTAEESSASVGLDDGRIVTLDEKTGVAFEKQSGSVSMTLTEGRLFLDVSDKLGADETMDIETSTMIVGIRGTIVYVSNEPVTDGKAVGLETVDLSVLSPEKGSIVAISQVGVLEGTAQITYLDDAGREQSLAVDAGQKATVPEYSEDADGIPAPAVSALTPEDIQGFVRNQVVSDPAVLARVNLACPGLIDGTAADFSADGDWTWDAPVTFIAQSASKYYDGRALNRSTDVLVSGLPEGLRVRAEAGGSRTDAGESENPISFYAIYNESGEDITRHFTNVEKVSGTLLVVPAPLIIHTGSAAKVYDGWPLTNPEAYVTFYRGAEERQQPWRNTAWVVTETAESAVFDSQTLYGLCGVIWVNAANPLTGERRELQLRAGQKLSIFLSDLDGEQSIELKIEDLREDELPEELLRIYAANPALLQQACKDTGWNYNLLRKLIAELPEPSSEDPTVVEAGLQIPEEDSERLMQNLSNVKITIDTEITDYNNRALGSEEAFFSCPAVDESIRVTATGRQTNAGTSLNTYVINWGSANKDNYEVGEELGTLTVYRAALTVTTGSAEKEYDGRPLTNSTASLSGLVNGETASVTATGSITDPGSARNTYSIQWGSANGGNYAVYENLGTLTVTEPKSTVTLTAASAEKTYDGTPLTAGTVTAEGLPSGYKVRASVSGSQTDAGSSENSITSYTILDENNNDVTGKFTKVVMKSGTLTVNPLPVEFDLGFHGDSIVDPDTGEEIGEEDVAMTYDGHLIFPDSIRASIDGADEKTDPVKSEADEETESDYFFVFELPGGAELVLEGKGYKDAGSWTFEPERNFRAGNEDNYEITYVYNSLEIQPAELTITASASKEFDGVALDGAEVVKVDGLVGGDMITVTATGTITDAGTAENPYTIDWGETRSENYTVTAEPGVLEVTPVAVTIKTGSADRVYNGAPLVYQGVDAGPWVEGYTPVVYATGTITDAGSTPNTYNIDWGDINPDNYVITEELGTLTVQPVELVLIADDVYTATTDDVMIESYGLKVEVKNVDAVMYQVTETGENTWQIAWEWGDRITVGKTLLKDDTDFSIVPVYDFETGNSGNYEIETQSQDGKFLTSDGGSVPASPDEAADPKDVPDAVKPEETQPAPDGAEDTESEEQSEAAEAAADPTEAGSTEDDAQAQAEEEAPKEEEPTKTEEAPKAEEPSKAEEPPKAEEPEKEEPRQEGSQESDQP